MNGRYVAWIAILCICGIGDPVPVPGDEAATDQRSGTYVWTGAGKDSRWSTPGNWKGGEVPGRKSDVLFTGKHNRPCFIDRVAAGLGSITLDETYTKAVVLDYGVVAGEGADVLNVAGDFTMLKGTLEIQGDADGDPAEGAGMTMKAENITIGPDAEIMSGWNGVTQRGFNDQLGPGFYLYQTFEGPQRGAHGCANPLGGTHGGRGAGNIGHPYGNPEKPTSCGSGGSAASGGGAIKLVARGTLTVGGTVRAHGESYWGAGAGGSVWLVAKTFAGKGEVSANGGDGKHDDNRGGGGGRVRIDAASKNAFKGTYSVSGGTGTVNGLHGTLSMNEWPADFNAHGNFAFAPGRYRFKTFTIDGGH